MVCETRLESYLNDLEICFGTSCNFCERYCPTYRETSDKMLTARSRNRIILGYLRGNYRLAPKMVEIFNRCTTCGCCERWCALPNLKIARQFKFRLINAGLELLKHKHNLKNIQNYGNPYGKPQPEPSKRWYAELKFASPNSSDILFFEGCTYSLYRPELLRKAIELLGGAENYLHLAPNNSSYCCGSYMLRVGYLSFYAELSDKILNTATNLGARRIVTPCPGCYSALRERCYHYTTATTTSTTTSTTTTVTTTTTTPSTTTAIKIIHLTELLFELYNKGKLNLSVTRWKNTRAVYHDPCHLGRRGGVFDPPRQLLKAIGIEVVEFERNRYDADCCGAGGGLRASYPELSLSIGKRRLESILKLNVDMVVTSCPFCITQFETVKQEFGINRFDIVDIIDLLYEALIKE